MSQQTIAHIQCADWDKSYAFDATNFKVAKNDYVVVSTQLGLSIAQVQKIESGPMRPSTAQMERIIRKADNKDLLRFAQLQTTKSQEALEYCKATIKRLGLGMKLVDVYFSLDEQRVTYAFVANGRIDFRELVKDLAQHYQKSIRLQQIGVRDETKISSDTGACGQQTCCSRFLKDVGNVNSQFAETQQVSHRGADRLSGVCGRLACCLKYEQDLYEEQSKGFPALGSIVKMKNGTSGKVRSWQVLKGQVLVYLDGKDAGIVEVKIQDIKK